MANVISQVAGAFEVLPSAARTTTPDTQELELPLGATFLRLVIDVTAVTATPSLTVTIAGVDRVSGKTYTLLASTAIATTGTTVLTVGPGLTAAANSVANNFVPPYVRITATHGDADSITYSIGGTVA